MKLFNLDSPVMVFLMQGCQPDDPERADNHLLYSDFYGRGGDYGTYYVTIKMARGMTRISSKDILSPLKRILSRRRSSG